MWSSVSISVIDACHLILFALLSLVFVEQITFYRAGLLIQDGMLISNQQNSSSGLNLTIGDALLLTNFVNQSQSLKSNEQNWIPICLPEFNANGYLQVWIDF